MDEVRQQLEAVHHGRGSELDPAVLKALSLRKLTTSHKALVRRRRVISLASVMTHIYTLVNIKHRHRLLCRLKHQSKRAKIGHRIQRDSARFR